MKRTLTAVIFVFVMVSLVGFNTCYAVGGPGVVKTLAPVSGITLSAICLLNLCFVIGWLRRALKRMQSNTQDKQ